MAMRKSILGQKFGKLRVMGEYGPSQKGKLYVCLCDCGSKKIVLGSYLRAGTTKSCGCLKETLGIPSPDATLRKEHNPEYKVWRGMLSKEKKGKVTVMPSWRTFKTFLNDIGQRPEGMSLIRKDVKKPFGPKNFKWGSSMDITHGKEGLKLTYGARSLSVKEWSKVFGCSVSALYTWMKEMSFDQIAEIKLQEMELRSQIPKELL